MHRHRMVDGRWHASASPTAWCISIAEGMFSAHVSVAPFDHLDESLSMVALNTRRCPILAEDGGDSGVAHRAVCPIVRVVVKVVVRVVPCDGGGMVCVCSRTDAKILEVILSELLERQPINLFLLSRVRAGRNETRVRMRNIQGQNRPWRVTSTHSLLTSKFARTKCVSTFE